MCRPASFVIVKGPKAMWSKITDSHEVIVEEHGLPSNTEFRTYSVAVEVVPPDGDFAADLAQWEFEIDQDRLPDWWNAEDAEREARLELEKWAACRLVRRGDFRSVMTGEHVLAVTNGGVVTGVHSGGHVHVVYTGGRVGFVGRGGYVHTVAEGGTVEHVDGGRIFAVEGGHVDSVHDGGRIDRVLAGGTVDTVHSGGRIGMVYRDGVIRRVQRDGVVENVSSKGVVDCVELGGMASVMTGTVRKIAGGTVTFYEPFATQIVGTQSVIIDRSGPVARCHVGEQEPRTVTSG